MPINPIALGLPSEGTGGLPADVKKLLLAQALRDASRGGSAPAAMYSPWQGVEHVTGKLANAMMMRQMLDESAKAEKAALDFRRDAPSPFADAQPSMGGIPSQPASGTSRMAAALARPPTSAVADDATATTPQGRIDNAWGGLTQEGRDIATRTVLGEAANQGPMGMQAVADVLRNRAGAGGYHTGSAGPTTMDRVALAPGQFEPHMTAGGRAKMASYSPTGAPYQGAQAAVDAAAIGGQPDVTGGATYFYAPQLNARLAAERGDRQAVPDWAAGRQPTATIGAHQFFGPQQQYAQAQPQQGDQARARAKQLYDHYDAIARDPSKPAAVQRLAIEARDKVAAPFAAKPPKYNIHHNPDGSVTAINESDPRDTRFMTNPGMSQRLIEHGAASAGARKTAEGMAERGLEAPQATARAREAIANMALAGNEALRLATHVGLDSATGPVASKLPTFREQTANFETDVETLGTKIFISTLNRMRELSKTGGAVGNVTEREMEKLTNSMRSLSLHQGGDNMRTNLRLIAKDFNDSMANIASAYKEQYGADLPYQPLKLPETGGNTKTFNGKTYIKRDGQWYQQ